MTTHEEPRGREMYGREMFTPMEFGRAGFMGAGLTAMAVGWVIGFLVGIFVGLGLGETKGLYRGMVR